MHNFNAPLGGGPIDGTAPDIYYFKQKEDGSFVFMLTSTNFEGFETNWKSEYVLVNTDAGGVIQNTQVKKLPVRDGREATLEFVVDELPSSYIADDKGFLYFQHDNCGCRDRFFNLNPETGQTSQYSPFVDVMDGKSFRTSDGGFITVGSYGSPDYYKYSESGILEFKQPINYFETRPNVGYLTDRNGEYYFIMLYNGRSDYTIDQEHQWFTVNNAKSFFYLKEHYRFMRYLDLEIRFGPGKVQKAHRFNRSYSFQDYVNVPFEVWDMTNNRQLMVSFRDQGEDGAFNLVPMRNNINVFYLDPASSDPAMSWEWIFTYDKEYSSTTPDQAIMVNPSGSPFVLIYPYLTEGATWDPATLPVSKFTIKKEKVPATQLIKVNASGTSVVKENYSIGSVPLKNIFKAVNYNDGFAVLINAPPDPNDYQPTQLVVLDAEFNQKDVVTMTSSPAAYGHQLEGNEDRVFYASLTSNAGNTNSVSLLLSVIRSSKKIERYLDDFIQYKLEKYRMTPTSSGGVAIVAWVRPTKYTRDLLFMEFDENLELVKR